jgi:membrane-associated phospholipid phosphatase
MLIDFADGILKGIINIYRNHNALWHLFAAGATFALVFSGFDWWFFSVTRGDVSNTLGMTAGLLGFFVPIAIPLWLYIAGKVKKNRDLIRISLSVVQAGVIAMFVIAVYKAFTGRVEPEFLAAVATGDNSREFMFGFLRYGIFWGWPSSHTGVAFAMSVFLALWYRRKVWVGALAMIYSSFIAVGAAVSFHWFSDVFAGIIIGSLIGYVIYKGDKTK